MTNYEEEKPRPKEGELFWHNSQHGKVDMLKAARSTIAEPVMRNKFAPRNRRRRGK